MTGTSTSCRGPVTDAQRAALGFVVGLVLMWAATDVFVVGSFDFENMRRGTRLLLEGVNPWAATTRIPHFYNPPHSLLFLWPTIFASPRAFLSVGSAGLFAFAFYRRAWVALAWFATNSALWLIGQGGVDMFVIGTGLLLLLAGDASYKSKRGLAFRVAAYGFLLVKPQGGVFIVALYILTRFDWRGVLVSILLFVLPFIHMYPSWARVILYDPPLTQMVETQTIWARYGLAVALFVALATIVARKWEYWQLGGALAGILTPYGMPGLPSFLTLASVRSLKAIAVVVLWSAGLAVMTWVDPPTGGADYDYTKPLLAIYHLSMFGLALTLACLSPNAEGAKLIRVNEWIRQQLSRTLGRIWTSAKRLKPTLGKG